MNKNNKNNKKSENLEYPDLKKGNTIQNETGIVGDKVQTILSKNQSDFKSETHKLLHELQEKGKLPKSKNTDILADIINIVGEKFGFAIKIDNTTLFEKNTNIIDISLNKLKLFLNFNIPHINFLKSFQLTGSAVGISSFMISDALGAMPNIEPTTLATHNLNLELIIPLLVILGIAPIIVKKFKKTKFEKDVFELYDFYKKFQGSQQEKKAKEDVLTIMMSELPSTMQEFIPNISDISKKDLKNSLKIKKEIDKLIEKSISEIEKKAVIDENLNYNDLNNYNKTVLNLFEKNIKILEDKYSELAIKWQKAMQNGNKYLSGQLLLEKKKLRYIINYLELLRKHWLIIVQGQKNKILENENPNNIKKSDKLKNELYGFKKLLNNLLKDETTLSKEDFKNALNKIQIKISEKETEINDNYPQPQQDDNVKEFQDENLNYVKLNLLNNGIYKGPNPVKYIINNEKTIPLDENIQVQIWFNEKNEIKMNFSYFGNLIDKVELKIFQDDLYIKDSQNGNDNIFLDEYIETKTNELKNLPSPKKADDPSIEFSPEGKEVLVELSKKVVEISNLIKSGDYNNFGSHVDCDGVDMNLIRIHKEHYQNKTHSTVWFTLNEHEWKKSLEFLQNQDDIPKYPIEYNFENKDGVKKYVNQSMIRFNVIENGKQAFVLIPKNDKYKALEGVVKIFFDSATDFSDNEINNILQKAFKKLGITNKINSVDDESKEKLQNYLSEIRKGTPYFEDTTESIHPEYKTENVVDNETTLLKNKGLHSLYHQCDIGNLGEIFASKFFLSTSTRWSKGILKDGKSSLTDLGNGGAKSTFTRIHTKESAKKGIWYESKPAVIFSPNLLKRADCYCYTSDKFGSRMPGIFSERVSPEDLVKSMGICYRSSNEVMFYDSISTSDVSYIVYDNPIEVINILQEIGINKIGGKDLHEAVITRATFSLINNI